jgi:hypothetical protein
MGTARRVVVRASKSNSSNGQDSKESSREEAIVRRASILETASRGKAPLDRTLNLVLPIGAISRIDVKEGDGFVDLIVKSTLSYTVVVRIEASAMAFHKVEKAFAKAKVVSGISKMLKEAAEAQKEVGKKSLDKLLPRGKPFAEAGGPSIEQAKKDLARRRGNARRS